MTIIVALILAGMYTGLKPIHDKNEALYNKKAILSAVVDHLDGDLTKMSNDDIQNVFNTQIKQSVINMDGVSLSGADMTKLGYASAAAEALDMKAEAKKPEASRLLPVFEYTKGDGSKFYILNVRGKGLWDEIWGNIALEGDLNTIAGVAFDHTGETPGLGAEIKDNKAWARQFIGKKIFGKDGEYKSVYVRKGGAKDDTYEVDGISGATITADGVSEMLKRGLNYYSPYIKTQKG